MDQDKIGKFILELRKSKNLTQEDLAQLIPIGRGAISKWERGIIIPDLSSLKRLEEIFDVSISEILCGERINKKNDKIDNVTLSLYKNNLKSRRIVKVLIISIVIFIIFFLSYYFINTYKTIKVYTVTGDGELVDYIDGIFIKTNTKLYFSIGEPNTEFNINKIVLYYIDENAEKQLLFETTDDNITFIDYSGYEEYFDISNINYIVDNLYLDISLEDDSETIHLKFVEDYVNGIFFNKKSPISINLKEDDNFSEEYLNIKLIDKIKKKFQKNNDGYFFEIKNDESVETFYYMPDDKIIVYTYFKDNFLIEEFNYDFKTLNIVYNNYDLDINFLFDSKNENCVSGNCSNINEILHTIDDKLNKILN